MAHSLKLIPQVLVEGPEYARWLTPAEAWKLCEADPRWEILDESDPRFRAVAFYTGPKPKRYTEILEDYGGQKLDI